MADFITQQMAVIVGVLGACFLGPVVALVFMLHRKRRVRASRRSPIAIHLLRSPGHSLREQLDAAREQVAEAVMLLMMIPLMMVAVFLGDGLSRGGLQNMMRVGAIFVIVVLGFVAFMVRKLLKTAARLDNLKAGYDAELAVGQELDQLMRQGAAVFHDIPADNFNIDHVVISSEGVFAVETKGFTKSKHVQGRAAATVEFDGGVLRFPTWSTKEPLEQAERQAAWLSKWLASAVGNPVPVLPVLALPGWFVERKGRGEVRVFSGKELAGLLKSRGGQSLCSQDVQRIAHQVEQRCRTVTPRYADDKRAT
jgi:hypothetical protein